MDFFYVEAAAAGRFVGISFAGFFADERIRVMFTPILRVLNEREHHFEIAFHHLPPYCATNAPDSSAMNSFVFAAWTM